MPHAFIPELVNIVKLMGWKIIYPSKEEIVDAVIVIYMDEDEFYEELYLNRNVDKLLIRSLVTLNEFVTVPAFVFLLIKNLEEYYYKKIHIPPTVSNIYLIGQFLVEQKQYLN